MQQSLSESVGKGCSPMTFSLPFESEVHCLEIQKQNSFEGPRLDLVPLLNCPVSDSVTEFERNLVSWRARPLKIHTETWQR